jgi:glycosyltransferase involved in cell wall biosynthesis
VSDFSSVESNSLFVSIVLPVFNAEQTIGSVLLKLVEQSYPDKNYEIIVVDNGSSDRSRQIIRKFTVKLLHETRFANSYYARNQGVLQATGDIIVFIDADCFPERDWLEILVRPFHDGSVGIVAGEVLSSHSNNLIQRFYEFSDLLMQRHKVSHQVALLSEETYLTQWDFLMRTFAGEETTTSDAECKKKQAIQ